MAKRVFDVSVAIVLLVLFAPVFGLIALFVRFSSPGPILFKQQRPGYRGKPFVMFKFRTMRDGSEKRNDLVKKGDPRITRSGAILRSSHLDELPQLWNVVRGDMSMVGPRPLPPDVLESRG